MKVSSNVRAYSAMVLAAVMLALSGCVVHDREVVRHDGSHDSAYQQGYEEGYYDREHHRYWHEKAWHDCIENDIHCPR
jgi:hypothetical protein